MKCCGRHPLLFVTEYERNLVWTPEIVRLNSKRKGEEEREKEQETDLYDDNYVLTKPIQLSVKTKATT